VPGYVVHTPVRPSLSDVHGVHRWWARREADGIDVTVTCLDAAPTPEQHAAAVELAGRLSRVHHPHLVSLRDIVTWPWQERQQQRFGLALVTTPGEAESLESVLQRRGHLSCGEAVTVLCPVAEVLQRLHDHGLLHGGLTAASIHITRSGMPMLADAAAYASTGQPPSPRWVREGYAAPEVIEGFRPTRQSDAYALAAVVWHTVVGQTPGSPASRADPASTSSPTWLTEMLREGLGSDPDARPLARDWLDALPKLGRPAPLDVTPDVGADLPLRLRIWAREPPRAGNGPSHRALRRPHARRNSRQPDRTRRPPGPTAGGAGPRLGTRARMGLSLLILVAVLAGAALVTRPWGSLAAAPSGETGVTARPPAEASAPGQGATSDAARPPSGPTAGPRSRPDPRAVVQPLLDARGRAWESGSPRDLDRASLRGSRAWRADRDDLERARGRAVDFERVRFRALQTSLVSAQTAAGRPERRAQMVVRARVRREPVVLRDPGGERRRYPASTETVVLTLRRGDGGWRLYDWD